MSEQWDDLHLRSNFSDTGVYPTGGTLSRCPDIIPSGTAPVSNPEDTFITNNWDKDMGQDLTINAPNYLYVRGQNLGTATTDGVINLYYSPANLILYPANWRENQLQTSGGQKDILVRDVANGGKFVTSDAFKWVPESISGTHYCLIGVAGTERHPNEIPNIDAIDDFAKFISENPNYGWRNVTLTSKNAPDFSNDIFHSQGSIEDNMTFTLVCENVPIGAEVAFSASDPLDPPINMPRTQVTNDQIFEIGMTTFVPAHFETNVTYSYWSNGTTPSSDWKITLRVSYFVSPSSALYEKYALPLEKMYSKELAAKLQTQAQSLRQHRKDDGGGPVRAIWVGGHSTYGQ
jgi:hypothetical protein